MPSASTGNTGSRTNPDAAKRLNEMNRLGDMARFPLPVLLGATLNVLLTMTVIWHFEPKTDRYYLALPEWIVGVLALNLLPVIVLVTKLAFLGWGIGSRRLDFTGISGHSTLAAAVLPMLAWWLTRSRPPGAQRTAVLAAWSLALVIGVSRVWLHAHSISEVVSGLALGTLVAWAVVPQRHVAKHRGAFRWALLAALLVAGLLPGVGESDEAHGLVVRIALQLSGRAEPFTRQSF